MASGMLTIEERKWHIIRLLHQRRTVAQTLLLREDQRMQEALSTLPEAGADASRWLAIWESEFSVEV